MKTKTGTMSGQDWLDRAICAQRDPELWFPDGPGRDGGEVARLICATCPVRQLCLQYALDIRPSHGIWAGFNVDGLRAMRTRQAGNRLRQAV